MITQLPPTGTAMKSTAVSLNADELGLIRTACERVRDTHGFIINQEYALLFKDLMKKLDRAQLRANRGKSSAEIVRLRS